MNDRLPADVSLQYSVLVKKGWFYLVFVRASKTDHHHDGMIDTNQIHKKLIYKLYHQLNNLQRAVLFPGHLQDSFCLVSNLPL